MNGDMSKEDIDDVTKAVHWLSEVHQIREGDRRDSGDTTTTKDRENWSSKTIDLMIVERASARCLSYSMKGFILIPLVIAKLLTNLSCS